MLAKKQAFSQGFLVPSAERKPVLTVYVVSDSKVRWIPQVHVWLTTDDNIFFYVLRSVAGNL